MLLSIAALLAGLALLVWSSDKFVLGASGTANAMGVPPLLIGLTIVGFGTSAPEMVVSAISALNNNPGLAIGNAIGSNIANIALILGASALLTPLLISNKIVRHEMPLLLAIMLFSLVLILDLHLGLIDGILLLLAMLAVMGWIVYSGLSHPRDLPDHDYNEDIPQDMTLREALLWLLVGLVLLVVSSRLMVWGAVNIAEQLGVSDLVIGLSIVALGTSLPELAASFACMAKKEFDIAIGNVLGSNMFNTLGVLGIAATIQPSDVDPLVLYRDLPLQFALMFLLLLVSSRFFGGRISRTTGLLMLCVFFGYQLLLFIQALQG